MLLNVYDMLFGKQLVHVLQPMKIVLDWIAGSRIASNPWPGAQPISPA